LTVLSAVLQEFFGESQQQPRSSEQNRTASPDDTVMETQQYTRGRRKAISGAVVTEEQASSYKKTV